MKKLFLLVSTMLFSSLVFVACGSDDDNTTIGGGETGGSTVETPQGNVTPQQEKEYIEAVGRDFVNQFHATDYQDLSNVAQELSEVEGEGIFSDFIKKTELSKYETIDLINLANISGTFTASYENKKWVKSGTTRSNGANLVMNYTDSNNTIWNLSAISDGSWGTITAFEDKTFQYDYSNYNNSYYSTTKTQITVPKTVTLTLTKGGSVVSSVVLNITNITFDGYEPSITSKMSYNMTSKIKDIEATNNVEYNPNGVANVLATVKKNDITLVSASVNGSTSQSKGEINNGKVTDLNIVIFNKLNIKGSISDINSLAEAMDEAYDNYDNEAAFDRWIKNANSYVHFDLYNNNTDKQASIIIGKDAYKSYSYNYDPTTGYSSKEVTRFRAVPMIKFNDDTTYSLDEYFDQESFQTLIDNVEKVVKEFQNLVK